MDYWTPLKTELEINANAEIAQQQADYMRGKYEFYGIKAPLLKKLFTEFYKEYQTESWEDSKKQLRWAWQAPEREWQMIGLLHIQKVKKLWENDLIPFTEELITTKSWWDTVDMLASNVVGAYLMNKPTYAEETMRTWNNSSDMWKVRTSIIFQIKYKEKVNSEFLAEAILNHSESKEFFINKAQGWALRQYSRFNPEWVTEFLNGHELSKLTVREGRRLL